MTFHIMAKPTGALCNMRCDYCFFLSKAQTLGLNRHMPVELLERFIAQYIESQPPGLVVFTWQGGEPTLAGLDYFQTIIALQQKYLTPEKTIANDLQTNGLLIDDDWCRFLKEHNFLVGLSLDGPPHLHNLYRKTANGGETCTEVLKTARLLHKYDIPFNTLTVLHRQNAKEPEAVYRFLRNEAGSQCMQFLPLVEPRTYVNTAPGYWNITSLPKIGSRGASPGNSASFVADWCVEPDDFGAFLCRVFDLWQNGDIGKIIVPYFECLLALHLGLKPGMCVFDSECGHALALDSRGDVYFCDRFCYFPYKLGSITHEKLADITYPAKNKHLAKMKGAVAPGCKRCKWARFCKGECPKNRFLLDKDGNPGLNYLCAGLQSFFEYTDKPMQIMAEQLRRSNS